MLRFLGFSREPGIGRSARPVFACLARSSISRPAALGACLASLLVWQLGCATAREHAPRANIPAPSREAQAAASFMLGHSLELEGRLGEAAEQYERAAKLDPESAQLQRFKAQIYARMGRVDEALASGRRALELEPDDERTLFALARLYALLQRGDEARALLEPRFEDDSLSPEGLFLFIELESNAERYTDAEEAARRLIEREPEDSRGAYALGAILERQGRLVESEDAYRRVLSVDPSDLRAYDAIARLRRRDGDMDAELAVLYEKLSLMPDDPSALMRVAQIHDMAGNRAAAIAALEQLVTHNPEQLSAQFQLGFYLYEDDRADEAIQRFEIVARNAPVVGDARFLSEVVYFLGRAYRDQGQDDKALAALAQIPPTVERFSDARILRARIYEDREDYTAAIADVRLGAADVPEGDEQGIPIHVYLAGLMQRDGDLDGAVELMQRLIGQHPDDADLVYDLGLIYSNAGDDQKSLELMLSVLEVDPDHASALNFVGYSWADKGQRLDEAEQMVRRAVELRPGDGYITDSLGWVYYQQGLRLLDSGDVKRARASFGQAILALEQALEMLEQADPVITWHLGDAYRSVSRFEDALDTYRRALTLEPPTEDAVEIQRQIDLLELQLRGSKGARH